MVDHLGTVDHRPGAERPAGHRIPAGPGRLAWFIFLLYTTWKSPTKQGYHDVFANTMVVKATRTAG